jgi:hypothetical protein
MYSSNAQGGVGSSLVDDAVAAEADDLATKYDAWAEECYFIADKQLRLISLRLNPVQRAIGAAEQEELAKHGNARIYVLKGRRAGVTTDQQARSLHCIWSTPFANTLTLAHTLDATTKIFDQITKRAVEHFPRELLPALGDRGAKEVHFQNLDSHFYTATAGSGNAARGGGLVRAHLSEYAFYDRPQQVRRAVTPSMIPQGSTVVLETTASAFESEPHLFWREAKQGGSGYRALFFPWWICDPVNDRLLLMEPDELGGLGDDEKLLTKTHGVSLEQIKWRRAKINELGGLADFLQEYPEDDETCWLTAGDHFFDITFLKALKLSAPEPIEVTPEGIRIFARPDGEDVIIGADTAEGVGGDRSTFVARGRKTWRLLAEYESRSIEPVPFGQFLAKVGRGYRNALLVVEKNAHGITTLRELRDNANYPIGSIYHRRSAHDEALSFEEKGHKIGWATTAESQPLMLDASRELLQAVKDGYASCPSSGILGDMIATVRDENGKISLNGKDLLVAEALCWLGRTTAQSRFLVA